VMTMIHKFLLLPFFVVILTNSFIRTLYNIYNQGQGNECDEFEILQSEQVTREYLDERFKEFTKQHVKDLRKQHKDTRNWYLHM
jgi:hypothetical protein